MALEASSPRYPESLMPIAGQSQAVREDFADHREDYLLNYGYNTARAYWNDLEEIRAWAEERSKDALHLTIKDLKQYAALLRRRKYSETTVRRRTETYARFRAHASQERDVQPGVDPEGTREPNLSEASRTVEACSS